MDITLAYEGKTRKFRLNPGSSVTDALRAAGINPQMVLVSRKKTIIPDTARLEEKDRLEVVKVVSGG